MKKLDLKRVIVGLFPILQWSVSYDSGTAVGDLIAGITVALTLIPQSIAYASLAGFEPQYGLYASLCGGFIYAILGTCPQINIGPTALLSLLTFTYTSGTNPDFAVLLCFMAGIVQLLAGVAQLGFLVDFVSLPVVSGFTSAAAITIASSQIKGLLGLKFNSESFVDTWRGVFQHIQDTRLPDTFLSLTCCIVLLGMKALKDIHIITAQDGKRRGPVLLQKCLWFAGVGRNAVVVVLAAVLAYFLHRDKNDPLILTARGRTLDATQEIVALGVSNIFGAFFLSIPVNGSFTRSAVSDASGVRSPAAGFYTSILVLLTLALLTPYFYFIPRAALAAVIVCAVLHMVDIAIVKQLWRSSRLDLIPLFGTFICCLGVGIEVGLICGVVVDMLLLLYYHSRPPLDLQFVNNNDLPPHFAIHPVGRLHFAGAETVRSKLSALTKPKDRINNALQTLKVVSTTPNSALATNCGRSEDNGVESNTVKAPNILVVYCDDVVRMDYTFLQSIKMLVAEWSKNGRVIWCNAKPLVKKQLDNVIQEPIYCESNQLRMFLTDASAVDVAVLGDTPL
ncbi:hypothetical protein ACJJTC_016053 [Scirpophaga incertulas]